MNADRAETPPAGASAALPEKPEESGMNREQGKFSLRNLSSPGIAALCWGGVICFGMLFSTALNRLVRGDWVLTLPEIIPVLSFWAVFFLIQLITAVFLGDCYDKTASGSHRRMLIVTGVLHGLLMLFDMVLFPAPDAIAILWVSGLSILLFPATGICLIALRRRWQGVLVTLFSWIAWIQPLFLCACRQ